MKRFAVVTGGIWLILLLVLLGAALVFTRSADGEALFDNLSTGVPVQGDAIDPTASPTATREPVGVFTPTPTPSLATMTPTPTVEAGPPDPTNTPAPVETNTPVPLPTNTPMPRATNTPEPLPTSTFAAEPTPTEFVPPSTSTPVPPGTTGPETATPTSSPTPTPEPATPTPDLPPPTNTPVPVETNTPAPVETNTPVPRATNTPAPLSTSTPVAPTSTSTPTATVVPEGTETASAAPSPTATEAAGQIEPPDEFSIFVIWPNDLRRNDSKSLRLVLRPVMLDGDVTITAVLETPTGPIVASAQPSVTSPGENFSLIAVRALLVSALDIPNPDQLQPYTGEELRYTWLIESDVESTHSIQMTLFAVWQETSSEQIEESGFWEHELTIRVRDRPLSQQLDPNQMIAAALGLVPIAVVLNWLVTRLRGLPESWRRPSATATTSATAPTVPLPAIEPPPDELTADDEPDPKSEDRLPDW